MTKQQTDNDDRQENTLGDLLLKTRKAQHKTLEDAAEATRINASFLHALEVDDFVKLPDEVFTRGFIRLYATYLGLDPDDTFNHYISQEGLDPGKPDIKPHQQDIINSELLDRTSIFMKKKSSKIMPVMILLAILVLFYILGVFFNVEEQPSDLQPETDITSSLVDNSLQADSGKTTKPEDLIAQKVAEPPRQPAEPAIQEPPVKSPRQAKQKVKTKTVAADTASPHAEGKPAQLASLPVTVSDPIEPAALPFTVSKPSTPVTLPITVKVATEPAPIANRGATDLDFKYVLEARFEESSQVRIKVDDKPQLQYNSQAGIVRIWQANESIVLDLDNRAGVSLTLNGQPFPLPETDGPTATINIPADLPTSNQP
jgi:cytoskeleton protein RodZ